jgi:hypothetical protein
LAVLNENRPTIDNLFSLEYTPLKQFLHLPFWYIQEIEETFYKF